MNHKIMNHKSYMALASSVRHVAAGASPVSTASSFAVDGLEPPSVLAQLLGNRHLIRLNRRFIIEVVFLPRRARTLDDQRATMRAHDPDALRTSDKQPGSWCHP
jgi:hypothetical protein